MLLYGSEIWTLKQKDKQRLKTAEIKFIRTASGYTLLNIKDILEELKVESVEDKINNYKTKWLYHV